MLNIWYANDLPYGPGPIGPRAPGPRALPCWANTSPENAPKKIFKLCICLMILRTLKRCATSVRSFWRRYSAEISAMCQKTKVSVFEKRLNFVRNLVSNLPSEFASEFALGICFSEVVQKVPLQPHFHMRRGSG